MCVQLGLICFGSTRDGRSTFKNDSEVVLTGRLSGDNSFHATEMTAKCPSKYDAAPLDPAASGQPNIGAGQTGGD